MLLYLEEFLDCSRLLISGRKKTYMDGKRAGVRQPAGWSSPFAGLCCEKSSFWLVQPLGGCLELAFGCWLSNLAVADVCFIRESLCRIPEQGMDFCRRLAGAIATRVGSGEKKQPCTLGFLFPVGFCPDQTCERRRERGASCVWGWV